MRMATVYTRGFPTLRSLSPLSRPTRRRARYLKAERHYQTMGNTAISVLSSLPYVLPDMYTLLLHEKYCSLWKASLTHAALLSSSHEKLLYVACPFGTCCMVKLHSDKSSSISNETNSQLDNIQSSTTGATWPTIRCTYALTS